MRTPVMIETSTIHFPSVIPSAAPRRFVDREARRREVEGSLRCVGSPYSVKAFSRELPDALWALQTFSGSFDCGPQSLSRDELTRRSAQDDRGNLSRPCELLSQRSTP